MLPRLVHLLILLSIVSTSIAQDSSESHKAASLHEKGASSLKRYVEGEEPKLSANGDILCGTTRCEQGTKTCCPGNIDFTCCSLRNASCCGSYCCDSAHPVCCGGGYCCGAEFSMCCGTNTTRWCCAGNMVCGQRPDSCERPDSAFPKIGLGILGVIIGLTVMFQIFNMIRNSLTDRRQVLSQELPTRPRRADDNSVVDLDLSDEEDEANFALRGSSSRHRRSTTSSRSD